MPSIQFFYADQKPLKWKVTPWKKWLEATASNEGFDILGLEYVFCSDQYLYEINVEHLLHDDYTDIITFDVSEVEEEEGLIDGLIYISLDRVRENAALYGVNFETELSRVMVHGVLHLCGYKDKSPEEAQVMREKEAFYMASSPVQPS
jgi:probable rRNA maturation factor